MGHAYSSASDGIVHWNAPTSSRPYTHTNTLHNAHIIICCSVCFSSLYRQINGSILQNTTSQTIKVCVSLSLSFDSTLTGFANVKLKYCVCLTMIDMSKELTITYWIYILFYCIELNWYGSIGIGIPRWALVIHLDFRRKFPLRMPMHANFHSKQCHLLLANFRFRFRCSVVQTIISEFPFRIDGIELNWIVVNFGTVVGPLCGNKRTDTKQNRTKDLPASR